MPQCSTRAFAALLQLLISRRLHAVFAILPSNSDPIESRCSDEAGRVRGADKAISIGAREGMPMRVEWLACQMQPAVGLSRTALKRKRLLFSAAFCASLALGVGSLTPRHHSVRAVGSRGTKPTRQTSPSIRWQRSEGTDQGDGYWAAGIGRKTM